MQKGLIGGIQKRAELGIAAGMLAGLPAQAALAEEMRPNIGVVVDFLVKPERLGDFKEALYKVIDAMSGEATFASTVVNEDVDDPGHIMLYEVWAKGTRDEFLESQFNPKEYRHEYEAVLPDMLAGERRLCWLNPIKNN